MSNPKRIMLDDHEYQLIDGTETTATPVDGMNYCVIRSHGAGVFSGYVKEQKAEANGVNVTLINSRRIWYWDGACSLSQLSQEGSKNIAQCKISTTVPEHFIADVIEILPMSIKAARQIKEATEWKK